MEEHVFHGNISPKDIANNLIAEFNKGNLRAQALGDDDNLTVQITTAQFSRSGGQTALAVNVRRITDGVIVQVGQQQWLGVAASLGQSAMAAIINPWNLLGRLDDIAQDIENLNMTERVLQKINQVVSMAGAGTHLSEKLTRLTCEYCLTANEVGTANCISCGAPLGKAQPTTCPHCGWVLDQEEKYCPNCGKPL